MLLIEKKSNNPDMTTLLFVNISRTSVNPSIAIEKLLQPRPTIVLSGVKPSLCTVSGLRRSELPAIKPSQGVHQ